MDEPPAVTAWSRKRAQTEGAVTGALLGSLGLSISPHVPDLRQETWGWVCQVNGAVGSTNCLESRAQTDLTAENRLLLLQARRAAEAATAVRPSGACGERPGAPWVTCVCVRACACARACVSYTCLRGT